MSEDVLVPDELIIDFSLPKEEIKKQLDDYEKACNEAFKKLGLLEDKKIKEKDEIRKICLILIIKINSIKTNMK